MPGVTGSGPALPPAVLNAMAALRGYLEPAVEPGKLDEPLEPPLVQCDESAECVDVGDSDAETDAIMDELDEANDDEAVLAIAKRLKWARRA